MLGAWSGPVGSRAGALAHTATFPAPATSNGACGFPALYVARHIICVMWRQSLCGEDGERHRGTRERL